MMLIDYLTYKVRYCRLNPIATLLSAFMAIDYYLNRLRTFTTLRAMKLIRTFQLYTTHVITLLRAFTLHCRTSKLLIPISVLLTFSLLISRGFVPGVL
jgi:hypothetical protein